MLKFTHQTPADQAYAAYMAGQATIKAAWLAIPENAANPAGPSVARYQLDTALGELYRLHCPGSPDYVAQEVPA